MENSVKTANPRRAELKALSAQLKPVAHESNTSLNAALVFHYAEQTGKQSQDFKTLAKWNEEGYSIKKGESSFMIWAKPEKMTVNVEEGMIGKEAEVVTVYKLAHLFHVGQVVKRKTDKQEPPTYAPAQVKTTFKKEKYNKAEA
jgi:N-terminal domain of anti-restriction factor ArdC